MSFLRTALAASLLSLAVGCAAAPADEADATSGAFTNGTAILSPIYPGLYRSDTNGLLRVWTTMSSPGALATERIQWADGAGAVDLKSTEAVVTDEKDPSKSIHITINKDLKTGKITLNVAAGSNGKPVVYAPVAFDKGVDAAFDTTSTTDEFNVQLTKGGRDGALLTVAGSQTSSVFLYWNFSGALTMTAGDCGGVSYTPGTSTLTFTSAPSDDPTSGCATFAALYAQSGATVSMKAR